MSEAQCLAHSAAIGGPSLCLPNLAEGQTQRIITREAEDPLRRLLNCRGVLSFLMAPIFVEGEWWGTAGVDDCAAERAWSAIEIDVLRTLQNLLAPHSPALGLSRRWRTPTGSSRTARRSFIGWIRNSPIRLDMSPAILGDLATPKAKSSPLMTAFLISSIQAIAAKFLLTSPKSSTTTSGRLAANIGYAKRPAPLAGERTGCGRFATPMGG